MSNVVLATSSTPLKSLVVVRPADKPTRGITTVTEMTIFAGPLVIAKRKLGGTFTNEDALAEFKRNARMFTPLKDYDTAKALGIIK
jgi:hypothetical protein